MFHGFLALAPSCTACGLDYGFADAGDGPAVFVTLFGGLAVVGLALWLDVAYDLPTSTILAICAPATILVCGGLIRPLKGLLVALQYRTKAEQGRLEP